LYLDSYNISDPFVIHTAPLQVMSMEPSIMSMKPPELTSPGYQVLPDFNGFLLGLKATSNELFSALGDDYSRFLLKWITFLGSL
jgi:hypothetical protein